MYRLFQKKNKFHTNLHFIQLWHKTGLNTSNHLWNCTQDGSIRLITKVDTNYW